MARYFVKLLLSITLSVGVGSYACADNHEIRHVPPTFELGKKLIVSVPSEGIKRGRILISDKDGIRIRKLERSGDEFIAELEFLGLALLKYQLQIEYDGGIVKESDYFYVRQPSTSDLEQQIRTLNDELSIVHTRTRQIENGLFSLNNTDDAVFQKRRSEELGKALIVLRKKEHEYSDALKRASERMVNWRDEIEKNARGKYVIDVRAQIEADNLHLWRKQ